MNQEINADLINCLTKETFVDLKIQIQRIDNYLMVVFTLVIILLIISGSLSHLYLLNIIFQSLDIALLFALLIVSIVGLFQYRNQYFILNNLPNDMEHLAINEQDIMKYYQEEARKLYRAYQRKNSCLNASYILMVIASIFLSINIYLS